MAAIVQHQKFLTPSEKEKLIIEHLGNDFDLKGSDLAILSKVIDVISDADTAVGVAELTLETVATWLPKFGAILKSSVFVAAVEGIAVSSIILFPVGALISVLNAYEILNRQYGMRAVAYTTVAWSFGDPIPLKSARLE